MLSESLCSAAQAEPLQPSCEYVYMHFTLEPPPHTHTHPVDPGASCYCHYEEKSGDKCDFNGATVQASRAAL